MFSKPIEWEVRWTFLPHKMVDGNMSDWSDMLAVRYVRGEWQYRKPTDDELREHFLDRF